MNAVILTAVDEDPVRVFDAKSVGQQDAGAFRGRVDRRPAGGGLVADAAVHRDLKHIGGRIRGHVVDVGALIERVRGVEARQRARIFAIAPGLPHPVHGAAEVAPHHHVGGAPLELRSPRRLEEAVAGRVFGGTEEVEQLRARLPARIGVYGHRHGRRTVGNIAAGALDVDPDALQHVVARVGTGREALRQHLVGAADGTVALVGLPEVLHHRVERDAVHGHVRRRACCIGVCNALADAEAHARHQRTVRLAIGINVDLLYTRV